MKIPHLSNTYNTILSWMEERRVIDSLSPAVGLFLTPATPRSRPPRAHSQIPSSRQETKLLIKTSSLERVCRWKLPSRELTAGSCPHNCPASFLTLKHGLTHLVKDVVLLYVEVFSLWMVFLSSYNSLNCFHDFCFFRDFLCGCQSTKLLKITKPTVSHLVYCECQKDLRYECCHQDRNWTVCGVHEFWGKEGDRSHGGPRGLAPTYLPVPLPSAYGSHILEHFMGQLGCWSSSHHIHLPGHQQKEMGERGRTVSLLPLLQDRARSPGTHSYHGTQERVFAQLALGSGRKWSSATLRSLMNMLWEFFPCL